MSLGVVRSSDNVVFNCWLHSSKASSSKSSSGERPREVSLDVLVLLFADFLDCLAGHNDSFLIFGVGNVSSGKPVYVGAGSAKLGSTKLGGIFFLLEGGFSSIIGLAFNVGRFFNMFCCDNREEDLRIFADFDLDDLEGFVPIFGGEDTEDADSNRDSPFVIPFVPFSCFISSTIPSDTCWVSSCKDSCEESCEPAVLSLDSTMVKYDTYICISAF